LKALHYEVTVKIRFEDLTLKEADKLERYLRDGLNSQKGFDSLEFHIGGFQKAPPADGKAPTGRKGIVQ